MFRKMRKFVLLFVTLIAVMNIWQTSGTAEGRPKPTTRVNIVDHALTSEKPVPVLARGFTVEENNPICNQDSPQLIWDNPGSDWLLVKFKVDNRSKCKLRFTGADEKSFGDAFEVDPGYRSGLSLHLSKGSKLKVECDNAVSDDRSCDYIISEIDVQEVPHRKEP